MSQKREFVVYQLQEEDKSVKTQYFGQGKIEFGQGKIEIGQGKIEFGQVKVREFCC